MAVPRSHLRFCRALFKQTRGEILRMTTIYSVAERIGMDYDEAAALAAELDEAGLLRVGGGHSVWLTEAGRQLSAGRAGPAQARRRAPARRSRRS
jgi:3-deoxy-D-arabino-heptulosonate 7-phosphate (DAHP) synthase class II